MVSRYIPYLNVGRDLVACADGQARAAPRRPSGSCGNVSLIWARDCWLKASIDRIWAEASQDDRQLDKVGCYELQKKLRPDAAAANSLKTPARPQQTDSPAAYCVQTDGSSYQVRYFRSKFVFTPNARRATSGCFYEWGPCRG